MKRKLLIASMALLCLSATSFAQTEKGNYLIGGSVGFGSNTQNYSNGTSNNKSNSVMVSPRIGYFFGKNIVVGLTVSYLNSKSTNTGTYETGGSTVQTYSTSKQYSYGGGLFLRHYTNLAEKFKFFGQISTDFSAGKSSQDYTVTTGSIENFSKYKNTNFSSAISPGFAFFPTKKWAIEFSFPLVSYTNQNSKDDGVNSISNPFKFEAFYFGLSSFNPNIGFNYHF